MPGSEQAAQLLNEIITDVAARDAKWLQDLLCAAIGAPGPPLPAAELPTYFKRLQLCRFQDGTCIIRMDAGTLTERILMGFGEGEMRQVGTYAENRWAFVRPVMDERAAAAYWFSRPFPDLSGRPMPLMSLGDEDEAERIEREAERPWYGYRERITSPHLSGGILPDSPLFFP
jgi:hypothetical protein